MDLLSSALGFFARKKKVDRPVLEKFTEGPKEQKEFEGPVTWLSPTDGIIDGSIKFQRSTYNLKLSVGVNVCGIASRTTSDECWQVEYMELVEGTFLVPTVEQLKFLEKTLTEKVVKIDGDCFTMESTFIFKIPDELQEYRFQVGDWIKLVRGGDVNRIASNTTPLEVEHAEPKEIKSVWGAITSTLTDRYIINQDILLLNGTVPIEHIPKDSSLLKVIPSDNGDCTWRVVHCTPAVVESENIFEVCYEQKEGPQKSLTRWELEDVTTEPILKISFDNESECINFHEKSFELVTINFTTLLDKTYTIHKITLVCPKKLILWEILGTSLPLEISSDAAVHLATRWTCDDWGVCDATLYVEVNGHYEKKQIEVRVHQKKMTDKRRYVEIYDVIRLKRNHKPNFDKTNQLMRSKLEPPDEDDIPKLNKHTYWKFFSNLVQCEIRAQQDILMEYNMTGVFIKQSGTLWDINVPGVEDGQPSLVNGMFIQIAVHFSSGSTSQWMECMIVAISGIRVTFTGPELIRTLINREGYCDVNFVVNTVPFHRALKGVLLISESPAIDYIFKIQPEKAITDSEKVCSRIEFVNKDLNKEQKFAVGQIVKGVGWPAPYIIFGPPGTGKTVTLVEAVFQVYKTNPESRILISCPTNSACDRIIEVLRSYDEIDFDDVVRLLAKSRMPSEVNEFEEKGVMVTADPNVLYTHRLIICTAVAAGGRADMEEDNREYFSHIFIDEAGQLTEPETCIPLSLLKPKGHFILTGDPKQLGPIIMDRVASKKGLQMSLLERLCSSVAYQIYLDSDSSDGMKFKYDERFVTHLVRNYRSHPDIIATSSKLFYHDLLLAESDPKDINGMLGWKHLPNPNCPVVLHGIQGTCERCSYSKSWCNLEEAVTVSSYVVELICQAKLNPSDIGVITPYRAQVKKIRSLVSTQLESNVHDVKVGSVEEFQGQEKKVIILSTVRSSKILPKKQNVPTLGFLSNEKRLNVSITRAKQLLIIVGEILVLQTDPNWAKLISFCMEKGAYFGPPVSKKIRSKLRNMGVADGLVKPSIAPETENMVDLLQAMVNDLMGLKVDDTDDFLETEMTEREISVEPSEIPVNLNQENLVNSLVVDAQRKEASLPVEVTETELSFEPTEIPINTNQDPGLSLLLVDAPSLKGNDINESQ